MALVSISADADRELRQRMERFRSPAVMWITPGPAHPSFRGHEVPDADLIPGPPLRWVFIITDRDLVIGDPAAWNGMLEVADVGGITVAVLAPTPDPSLAIELRDEAIRVREVDA